MLYFLTNTVTEGSTQQLSTIQAFNLAESTQEILLSSDSHLVYNQMAISEKYLMISQSPQGKDPNADLPILFCSFETQQLEELMEISGSYPLMSWPLAAWSDQGPNQFPETFKIFDFESSLSRHWVKGGFPCNFDLSKNTWSDNFSGKPTFCVNVP